ncbi:MAG: hypothetical protein J1E38_09520 [Paramuribaculum sp.]|nr:hypothetical protein [Paramuribaculum sp.]
MSRLYDFAMRSVPFITAIIAFLSVGMKAAVASDYLPNDTLEYEGRMTATAGRGDFAPFYISANRFGTITSARNIFVKGKIEKKINKANRFSYGFVAELIGGASNGVEYERYSARDEEWYTHKEYPGRFRIEQLYGEIKWRSVEVMLGMKEKGSSLLTHGLSSGDMTLSANSRPIPQLSAGFVDFQDIPFTKGWLQIEGELSYGKFTDAGWWKNHADYYSSKLASGTWFTYRRVYFRTKPDRMLTVTFGVQSSAQFGGKTEYYYRGKYVKTDNRGIKFADFFKILFPPAAGKIEDFAIGNTLGSWDARFDLRLRNEEVVSAYFEWPWEDGSGMAKRNGLDGLYGIEYRNGKKRGAISDIVVEYLDLTNQSGPIHWAPGDHPGTGLTGQATGADDYYNNAYYNSYANYGMGMGNAMVMSPLYNRDGYMAFIGNRMRGFHVGAEGWAGKEVKWKFLGSWRKAYGNGFIALLPPRSSFSFFGGASWSPERFKGWSACLGVGLDRGKLPGNAFGLEIGLTYKGKIGYGR